MSDIAELERRITTALERISAGVNEMAPVGEASDDSEAVSLNEALEAEKLANAQLEERVSAIKVKQETNFKEMTEQIAALKKDLTGKEADAKTLLKVNAQLRESNDELRAANESSVGDSHLINKAMQTDLEALRATRKADLAELEAIMTELKPLIGEGA